MRSARVDGFRLAAIAAATLLAACRTVPLDETARLQPDKAPVVTARWLHSCSPEVREAFFSLELFQDGRVHYLGTQQARVIGSRDIIIHRATVAKILSYAKSHVSRTPKPPRLRNEAYYGKPSHYCLEVSVPDRGRVATSRKLINEADLHGGIRMLDRMIAKNAWVCPSRSSYPNMPLNYCLDRSDMALVTLNRWEGNCSGLHSIALYPDGTLYYHSLQFSAYVNGNRPARVAAEGYHAISKREVEGVVQLVTDFHLPRSRGLGDTLVAGFSGSSIHQVEELERRFRALVPIDWATLHAPEGACAGGQEEIHFMPGR